VYLVPLERSQFLQQSVVIVYSIEKIIAQDYGINKIDIRVMKNLMLIGIVLLIGCKPLNRGPVMDGDILSINIDSLNKSKEEMSISEILYIPLETTDLCLLGDVSKILYFKNNFYIFDRFYSKNIYVFNRDGKFINKIIQKGRGPGEIIELTDFDIDEQGNIYAYDNRQKKIILFSIHGDVLGEFKVPVRFLEFFAFGKDKGYFLNTIEKDVPPTALGLFDLNKKDITVLLASKDVFDEMSNKFYSKHYLFRSGSTGFYNQRFTGNVFRLSDDGLATLDIRVGPETRFPDEEFVIALRDDQSPVFKNPEKVWDIRNIYENSQWISLQMSMGIDQLKVMISKKDYESLCFGAFDRNYYVGNQEIIGIADDFFISEIPSRMYSKLDWGDKIGNLLLPEEQKLKLRQLSLTSNPTIILYKVDPYLKIKSN